MIAFVYYVCLLIVCCRTTKIENEENDYNNDSPDTLPEVKFLQYKIGADVIINCNKFFSKDNASTLNEDNITWEFKRCDINSRSFYCDGKSMFQLDDTENQWEKLDFNRKRKKLVIRNVTEDDIGLYRCLYNDSIIRIYRVDIVVAVRRRPRPRILTLTSSSNGTITETAPIVIQCKAESEIKPEIRWFKECKCDVNSRLPYNGHCYCSLTSSNYAYPISYNVYVSKLNIDVARDVDSGTYVCLAITVYGEDHKNVTIVVGNPDSSENAGNSFSLLFLIPLVFVLVPVIIWFGFYIVKTKNRRKRICEHQKQLIQPIVKL